MTFDKERYQKQMQNLKKPLSDTCMIEGCDKPTVIWYPLMNRVRFCHGHNKPEIKRKYGCIEPDDNENISRYLSFS